MSSFELLVATVAVFALVSAVAWAVAGKLIDLLRRYDADDDLLTILEAVFVVTAAAIVALATW